MDQYHLFDRYAFKMYRIFELLWFTLLHPFNCSCGMEKVRLRVQWRDGAFLPVLVRADSLGREVIKMLKFACGPCQKLSIFFNEVPIADQARLDSYGIKNDDIIQATITSKDSMKMVKALDRVVREAARVSDMHIDRTGDDEGPTETSSDDVLTDTSSDNEQTCVVLPAPTVMPKRSDVRIEPLPNLWVGGDPSNEAVNTEAPQYSTRREAIAFFASQGRKWVW